ncbi:hypothetical protein [Burkholderia pseudomallei]|uniref:hypothetical protein n=1 Tax=Burkholderia pseudomallei TaxID=28450 RepID=UPI000F05E823|nr:hypothetical protein [Burkholderia pseudomallei]VBU65996.1 Uncharacterised protein [Burkholderia pseudomallei]
MKANDLSKLLRQAAELLDLYEGKDLRHVLDDLIKLKSRSAQQGERAKPRGRASPEQEKTKLNEFASWCASADLREIEAAIQSNDLFSIAENIRALASMLGLNLGKRQSREDSIQTLMSYLDRTRVHQVISRRNSPDASAKPAAGAREEQGLDDSNDEERGIGNG